MKQAKYVFLAIVAILLLEANIFAAPPPPEKNGTITVIGETHSFETSEWVSKELTKKAKNNEIIFMVETGVGGLDYNSYSTNNIYSTENSYVVTLAGLIDFLYRYYKEPSLISPKDVPYIAGMYNQLISFYAQHPSLQEAIDNFKTPTHSIATAFCKKFKNDVKSSVTYKKDQDPSTIFKERYGFTDSSFLYAFNYLIENTLLALINDPKYENEYLKELPEVTPPANYKEGIKSYVATLDKSTDLDVVENAHNYINRTISIDWRNRVTAGYLKILLSDQKAEGTKPIYIVVGKLHLEGLSELLQLNFGSSFKVKSLFLNTDPDLQGTFDNLEDKTVLESSAKKILAEGIPETDTYDVKVGKIYVLVKYKNYLQSNNRAYEANTIQKFLGDLSLESEGLEKFINIANGSSTYVNADKALLKMNAKLKKASPTDTGSLLGENGLLTLALNRANLVIGTDSPDFEACSETMDLGTAIIAKLIDEKADVTSVVEKLTALSSKMSAYSKALNSKTASETSLDKILEKKALGETEFNELFGNANGVAASIMEQYNKDPKDPLNAIRVLIVEKLLRHFETVSNEKDAPAFSSEIIKNDFFRTDSDTYTTWKTVVDKIKVEELKAETADKKEALEKYKIDLKSIDEFKVE